MFCHGTPCHAIHDHRTLKQPTESKWRYVKVRPQDICLIKSRAISRTAARQSNDNGSTIQIGILGVQGHRIKNNVGSLSPFALSESIQAAAHKVAAEKPGFAERSSRGVVWDHKALPTTCVY